MRSYPEKRRRVFFAEHDAILREQYADASSEMITSWAKAWNVSRDAIRNRALVLGVRRSQAAKEAALAQGQHDRNGTVGLYEIPEPNRDEDYSAACLAEGGFGRFLETRGRNGEPRLTGPYVPFTAERNARRSQVAA
jgi:hypothetical protein